MWRVPSPAPEPLWVWGVALSSILHKLYIPKVLGLAKGSSNASDPVDLLHRSLPSLPTGCPNSSFLPDWMEICSSAPIRGHSSQRLA